MRRTQKEISESYRGNLDYFRKPHYMRRLRGIAFAIAVLVSLGAAFGYFRLTKKPEFFNTGPLSLDHRQFQNRCEVCHTEARPDLASVLKFDRAFEKARSVNADTFKTLPADGLELVNAVHNSVDSTLNSVNAGTVNSALEKLTSKYSSEAELSKMDKACIQCHDAFSLHQPQAAALSLRPVSKEIPVVHAIGCAVCHREHQGPGPIKFPARESCESCHANREVLVKTLNMLQVNGKLASRKPEIRDFGDGARRFIPPRQVPHQPVAFKTFAQGHPSFGYEKPGMKDPAAIRYNHARHEQADIPLLNGRKLDCVECHKPGANGQFYQRIDYEQHCATCHSLHFDPDVPKMAIPHGDPEKVRDYLRSLYTQYTDYAQTELGMTTEDQMRAFAVQQTIKLNKRGISDNREMERRVFYTGDPPEVPGRVTTKSNKGQFFAGCAKCHEITPPDITGAPKITPTNMADRWLTRGPFTHAPHTHIACTDCHGAAKNSNLTTDILMPTQQSCAECHRQLQGDLVKKLANDTPEEKTAKQKREGGIAADCQSCHKFHTPAEANALFVRKTP